MSDALPAPVALALSHVRSRSHGGPLEDGLRVTLNFHPDRLFGGELILRAMAREGTYRSQFETHTSNGGLTAHPGGNRWIWESRIFDGAYDAVEPALRPKYGALNRTRAPYGAAPRFGSAHLRLAARTLARTTFCFPDSVFEPEHFGVAERYALPELADAHPALFPGAEAHDPLDDYVEAHVHGVVDLSSDVEALVLDPCYRGGPIEEDAEAFGIAIEWHAGYVLDVDTLRAHSGYRGQEFVELGTSLAENGVLTPRIVGDASRTGGHDERPSSGSGTTSRASATAAEYSRPRPRRSLSPDAVHPLLDASDGAQVRLAGHDAEDGAQAERIPFRRDVRAGRSDRGRRPRWS